jgi:phage gp29-like protein
VPVGLHPIQGRRWAFDDTQALRLYDDGLRAYPGDDVIRQYPARFLVHQPRVNGDAPTREGLGRVLVWLACFASWSWRDWMLFAELFGKPWRILTLDRSNNVQTEDEAAAEQIVQDATASTSILLYENMKLDIRWPDAPGGASASPSPAIIDKAAQYIALATLGQLGTTGSVQNGLGGKGDAREKVRADILHADGMALAATLRHLLTWMVAVNFGAAEPVPTLSFSTDDIGDTDRAAKVLDTAVNKLSLPVSQAHAYATLGIPQPANGEALLGGATAGPRPAATPPPGDADPDPDADPTPPGDEEPTP